MRKNLRIIVILILLFLLLILSSYSNFFIHKTSFSSADEAANYLVTREYSLKEKMELNDEYYMYDEGNNLHHRGLINFQGKLVPFNFLGLPFLYRPAYVILGDYTKHINLYFLAMLITIFLSLCYFLFGKDNKNLSVYSLLALVFCIPIIYFMNKPFHNIIPALTFFVFFAFYLLRFNKSEEIKFLYLSELFALLSIWFRYDYFLFVFIFLIINISNNKAIYSKIQNKIKVLILVFAIALFVFVLPLLYLNNNLYGDPLTYGYRIFTESYFKEERTGSLTRSAINILFPSQSFNSDILITNFLTVLVYLSPLLFAFSLFGLIENNNFKKIKWYLLFVLYILIYMGSGDTYLSGSEIITVNKAIMRYWITISFSMVLLFIAYLNKNRLGKKTIVLLLTVLIIHSITFSFHEYFNEEKIVKKYDDLFKNVDPDSYIIAGPLDKFLIDKANPITWQCKTWNEQKCLEEDVDYESLSNLITELIRNNEEVYFPDKIINIKLKENLMDRGIDFIPVNENFSIAREQNETE